MSGMRGTTKWISLGNELSGEPKKSKYILYLISASDGLVYYASFTEENLKKFDLMSIFIVYIILT